MFLVTAKQKKRSIISRGMRILALALLGVVCIFSVTGYGAEDIKNFSFNIQGLEDSLQQNVSASLSLQEFQYTEHYTPELLDNLLSNAPDKIRNALQPFGYYSPKISISQSQQNGHTTVLIHIDKGEPILVQSVVIDCIGKGCENQRIQKVVSQFPLRSGDIFNHQVYSRGKQQLITKTLDLGFQKAFFEKKQVAVNEGNKTADITLHLDVGLQYYFGAITYKCGFIKERILKRITGYRQGDPFSPRALTTMRQALLATEYFDTAEVEYDLSKADQDGNVPVTITLTRGKRNRYGIGMGYGTDTGIRGSLEWYNHRLNKYGHQLDLQWQPSERKSYFGGIYTIPISDPNKERVTVLGKWENENYDNTDTESLSTAVSYDHLRKNGEYSIYLRYIDEDYTIGGEDGQSAVLAPGAKISWRWVDNRIKANQGLSVTAEFCGGNKNFLSDTTFIQGSVSSKIILRFLDRYRFIGFGKAGATIADTFYDLPPTLRFYAGGDQSVRGYGYKRIGPEDSEGNIIGGKYLLTYSAEIERQLSDTWGVAMFLDSGTATNEWDHLEMKHGAGAGLRWYASFGQLRFDVARTLDDGNNWRVHFTLGADF